ncbi:MAG: hypothetical protein JWN16_183 [Alphaproteobacteria bacterium]|nr:hypothetical protein [Alphaproteobacteria bacterium]
MSWIAKAACAAALLNCAPLAAYAAESPSQGQWLKDGDCSLFNADAHPGDKVNWSGACEGGYANGMGTAVFIAADGTSQSFTGSFAHGAVADGPVVTRWGAGWSYEGEAKDGVFNGAGILTTAEKDRFEGQWADGKMSGFGVLRRANGERYAGDWKNDKPNGTGELRHADGTLVSGIFVDGKLSDAPKLEKAIATPAPDSAKAPFSTVSGKTLTGVDGSSVSLTLIEGGMELQQVPGEGRGSDARKTTFTFMTDRMGTVVEDTGNPGIGSSVTGFFRLTGKGVEVRYADGRSAMLSAKDDGGVQLALDGDLGASCRSWYPAGHAFSDAEKKAAVNAYASRLGLATPAESSNTCGGAPVAAVIVPPAATAVPKAKISMREVKAPARLAKASYRVGDFKGLETVSVKTSEIHAIDDVVMASPKVAETVGAIAPKLADRNDASKCLAVDSDGGHWGFRNTCGFAVQFAYCMADGSDALTACTKDVTVSIAGSVAANGFGALTADNSLKEKDTDHKFRWIACGGGAGEVVAHLDHFEPPAGRCERTRTASNQ